MIKLTDFAFIRGRSVANKRRQLRNTRDLESIKNTSDFDFCYRKHFARHVLIFTSRFSFIHLFLSFLGETVYHVSLYCISVFFFNWLL